MQQGATANALFPSGIACSVLWLTYTANCGKGGGYTVLCVSGVVGALWDLI
jgi:hypothetical protein